MAILSFCLNMLTDVEAILVGVRYSIIALSIWHIYQDISQSYDSSYFLLLARNICNLFQRVWLRLICVSILHCQQYTLVMGACSLF